MSIAPALPYPTSPGERDAWILARRGPRSSLDYHRAHSSFMEEEPTESGCLASVATVFLTNRECPWHCLMCDLWRTTLLETVPSGAIPTQIESALRQLGFHGAHSETTMNPSACHAVPKSGSVPSLPWHVKLYNSGSFFDRAAIPPSDLAAIAKQVAGFERVIVECHPALVGSACVQFRDLLEETKSLQMQAGSAPRRLEVAMGLETTHPEVLERLNKRMTLDQFARAADFLRRHDIGARAFILVKPPFLDEAEALFWAERSIEFAFETGIGVASLIPTRVGNGALDALQSQGLFSPPNLATLESAQTFGLRLGRGRVLADLWDLERISTCAHCFQRRLHRMQRMNLEQIVLSGVECGACGATGSEAS